MNSWSNKTAWFRFSIKYLKLKVVLQIVCLVLALLAPKLIFYISSRHIFTNFKDAAFSSHLLIRLSSVRSRDHRQLCVNHLIPKYQKYSTGWLSATTIKCLLKNAIVQTKFQNTAIPWPVTAKISLVIFFVVCLSDKCNVNQCRVRMGLSILGKGQACIDQPQNREKERKNRKK